VLLLPARVAGAAGSFALARFQLRTLTTLAESLRSCGSSVGVVSADLSVLIHSAIHQELLSFGIHTQGVVINNAGAL